MHLKLSFNCELLDTGMKAFQIYDTPLTQSLPKLPRNSQVLLPLNGNWDGAVDKYFFLDCLDPFFGWISSKISDDLSCLVIFFSFSPRRRKRCKGALPAAGNQFIQSRVACRERWDTGSLI